MTWLVLLLFSVNTATAFSYGGRDWSKEEGNMIQVHYEAFKEGSQGFTKYVLFKNKLKNYTFLNTYGLMCIKIKYYTRLDAN